MWCTSRLNVGEGIEKQKMRLPRCFAARNDGHSYVLRQAQHERVGVRCRSGRMRYVRIVESHNVCVSAETEYIDRGVDRSVPPCLTLDDADFIDRELTFFRYRQGFFYPEPVIDPPDSHMRDEPARLPRESEGLERFVDPALKR